MKQEPPPPQNNDTMREIAEALGTRVAITLAQAWGGTALYVPAVLPPEHPLIFRLGREDAEALVQRYAGCTLEISRDADALRPARNEAIYRDWLAKISIADIARSYGLGMRMIRYIVAQQRYEKGEHDVHR